MASNHVTASGKTRAKPIIHQGLVSIVLVNFRRAEDTVEALSHIDAMDWPRERLEVVVVENGSGDDSAEYIRNNCEAYVRVVVSKTNRGFAGGCNFGVAHASGEFIALLNNDAKPDALWIKGAIDAFKESTKIGAVASKVLSWDGSLVDYVGSAMTWFGMGYKPLTAEPVPRDSDSKKDVLFGTGSAMVVRRDVYDQLGGFDESFFMFFEDVDFGWRLNLLGWRFVYEPKSIAYHKHHASMGEFGPFKETYLLERNALFTLYKNTSASRLNETMVAATMLAVRRAVARSGLESTALDLRGNSSNEDNQEVSRQLLAGVFGIDQFVEHLPQLTASRAEVQATRTVSDSGIWRLFGLADAPVFQNSHYVEGYEKLVTAFDVSQPPRTTRVLIITGDPIGVKLAGPAIRAWNMADLLARQFDVQLVSLTSVEAIPAAFDLSYVRAGDEKTFARHEKWADVIIFQGHAMAVFDTLKSSQKILVADIYDPMHLEQLEQGRELPREQWNRQVSDATDVLNEQLARGDFFLCASERQRMFWLGQLAALGRINPSTYRGDPDLYGLIAVAPFGLPSTPPVHERHVLKGQLEGIGLDDKVLLWSGGLYNWFDPETLVRAVGVLAESRPNVRLFFQGTKHPHPGVPEMAIVEDTRRLAKDLGILDRNIFLNDSWVAYSDRQNYLCEADAGVSTHHSHIETTFSFRTRILDYLWAELPIVVTAGDHFADLVEREGLGLVVAANDSRVLADALDKILYDSEFAAACVDNIKRVRAQYYWEKTLAPLVEFVQHAHHAEDKERTTTLGGVPAKRVKRSGFRHDINMAIYHLKNSGVRAVASKAARRMRRR